MQVEEGQGDLDEPFHDLRLAKGLALVLLDFLVNIATVAIDHHDVELLLFVEKLVLVGDDIGVAKFLEQADLELRANECTSFSVFSLSFWDMSRVLIFFTT